MDHIGPCLHYVAGVSWAVAAVFGGIMIVTGPTVIAQLLRQAKLSHRPAALLQWEAIVNDPIGALAAVLAYEVIVVSVAASSGGVAAVQLIIGLVVSIAAALRVDMALPKHSDVDGCLNT